MKRLCVFTVFAILLSCTVPVFSYAIPEESNMVRVDGIVSFIYSSSSQPDWAAMLITLPDRVVRLDCGNLAQDRGCFELMADDRVLIYGSLKASFNCGYDPPCTEVQVDNIRRYDPATDVWSLWDGDSWESGI